VYQGDLVEAVRWATTVGFAVVALVALRSWRRTRTVSSAWLAASFVVLALVVVGRGILRLAGIELPVVAERLSLLLLLAFPYLLVRFSTAFGQVSARKWWAIHALAAVVVAATVALPELPGAPRPGWYVAYVLLVLAYWTALSVDVAVRLWRSGVNAAALRRQRLRTLAVAALALNAALLPAGAQEGTGTAAAGQLVALGSMLLFLAAYAPPSLLREVWRAPDKRLLRRSEAGLVDASSPEEVGAALLPYAAHLVGGNGAVILDRAGQPVAAHGEAVRRSPPATPMTASEARLVQGWSLIQLRSGTLAVHVGEANPFFGIDEVDILRGVGSYIDLMIGKLELLATQRAALERVEQLNAELEALVYGISHDLRSPVISILAYLDFMTNEQADRLGEEARHYLQRMTVNARYMDALIKDLLELSRIGRVQTEMEDVALDPLAGDIARELGDAYPQAAIEVGPLPVVRMSPVRARQLLTNLIENALHHGGRSDITVRLSAMPLPDGGVEVSVRDDGVGVPAAYRERVFGVFERLEGTVGVNVAGTGIGLAICQKIVEELDGRIWIAASDPGADVRVALPPDVVRVHAQHRQEAL
jgi:signal transduction histidine kinase